MKLITFNDSDEYWLPEFYSLYGRVFTLPEEREPIEGFRRVLELNQVKAVQDAFGPLSERITIAVDEVSNAVVGATNYIFYGYPDANGHQPFGASGQLNFICVDPNYRNRGIARMLLADLENGLQAFATELDLQAFRMFLTCEQNNPERMSEDQIRLDQKASQIDPYERLLWWRKLGYRKLEFPYRQPPLNPGQEPCDYLDYFVRFVPEGSETASIPASILAEHLRRFFAVSVGKLAVDMDSNKEWSEQKAFLNSTDNIEII